MRWFDFWQNGHRAKCLAITTPDSMCLVAIRPHRGRFLNAHRISLYSNDGGLKFYWAPLPVEFGALTVRINAIVAQLEAAAEIHWLWP